MSSKSKNKSKAQAAFKKPKDGLKPWEVAYRETAAKSERLKALRLAREAVDNDADAARAAGITPAAPQQQEDPPGS